MTIRTPAMIAALFALGLSLPVASAQDRLSRTELTAITNELGLSVEELKTKNAQLQVQNADIALQMRELAADNAQLNGRIETLQFQLGQSRDDIARMQSDDQEIGRVLEEYDGVIEALKKQVSDLEARLSQREQVYRISDAQLNANGLSSNGGEQTVESVVVTGSRIQQDTAATTSTVTAARAAAVEALPSEADPLFQDGKARLLRFDYEGAERSFRVFLERYGDNAQAGEAQYWLGEVLFQQKSYSESGAAYSEMIRKYPTNAKAPDALVKLGRSLRLVGDQARACAILATLPTRYPNASPVTRQLADTERTRSACQT